MLTGNKTQMLTDLTSIALGVDAAVIGKNITIAGTGKFSKYIGKSTPPDTYLATIMHSGDPFIIEDATYESKCYKCSFRSQCFLIMVIGHPIINDANDIMGSLVLLATNKKHREILRSRRGLFMKKLPTISQFFSDALSRQNSIESVLLNFVDDPIIITNAKGAIINFNQAAEYLARCSGPDMVGHDVDIVLHELGVKLGLGHLYSNKPDHVFTQPNTCLEVIAKPITVQRHIIGHVIRINNHSHAHAHSVHHNQYAHKTEYLFDHIVGESLAFKKCIQLAKKIANTSSIILIQGETGTGKELFAHGIHQMSQRVKNPLIIVNCGALPDNLIESELFGYVEGAFTGAKKGGKIGKFELANNGTLFLDEIGELPLGLQSKLLRVLEDGRLDKVGGKAPVNIDVRVIAATNRNLAEMVKEGTFRKDLFYRLNMFTINIPPLRDRVSDIPLYIKSFISCYTADNAYVPITLSHEVEQLFMNYDWPGNVRELKNTIQYCIHINSGGGISINDLPDTMKELYYSQGYPKSGANSGLKCLERAAIEEALSIYGPSTTGKKMVAKSLGIGLTTLYRRLESYKLDKRPRGGTISPQLSEAIVKLKEANSKLYTVNGI